MFVVHELVDLKQISYHILKACLLNVQGSMNGEKLVTFLFETDIFIQKERLRTVNRKRKDCKK